jgi:hypothetical protein
VRTVIIDGCEVLKVNNYNAEAGGISAWEEIGGEQTTRVALQTQHQQQHLSYSRGGRVQQLLRSVGAEVAGCTCRYLASYVMV